MNILEFLSIYCDNSDAGQQLYKQLETININTLILDQKNQLENNGSYFEYNFTEGLNIANLVLINFNWINQLNFNVSTLKEVNFRNISIRNDNIKNNIKHQPDLWQMFKGSSVKSVHIDSQEKTCYFNPIDQEFGEVFTSLEFATFDCVFNSGEPSVVTRPVVNKVNAFEMIKKLKFLTISNNNMKDVNWLFKSYETVNGNPVQVSSYENLVRLDLSYNKILSLPELGFTKQKFTSLKYLNLRGNQIYTLGTIPPIETLVSKIKTQSTRKSQSTTPSTRQIDSQLQTSPSKISSVTSQITKGATPKVN